MATSIGPNGVCEYETNTYDVDGKSASIIDVINNRHQTLFFRGITAGSGITVDLIDTTYPDGLGYSLGKTIQINSTGGSSATVSVKDAGATGTSIIGSAGVENNTIPLRTIAVSNGLTIAEENDIITISADSGLGAKWFVITTTTPDDTTGSDGDMLLNSSGEVYSKVSGKWTDSTVNITGPKGDQGIQGVAGPQGVKGDAGTGLNGKGTWVSGTTYTSGDYVIAPESDGSTATALYIYEGAENTPSTVAPADDSTNWVKLSAPQGARGSKWTVSNTTTAPTNVANADVDDQYLTSDGKIYTLTAIAADSTQTWTDSTVNITGPKGDQGIQGEAGKDGTSTTVTVGTTTTGAAGSSASVTSDSTSTTEKLILNFTIPSGKDGTNGTDGTNGKDGSNGTQWFVNKTATDGSTLKSDGGRVGDYCLIGTGEIYTLSSIDASNNETWTDTGISILGPKGDTGTAGTNGTNGTNGAEGSQWYLGTIASPSVSTISTDPVLSGVTLEKNDAYLGQDLYVYQYNGTAWTKSTTYLGSDGSDLTISFDSTGTSLGTVASNKATVYSLAAGSGVSLATASNTVTISTLGTTISTLVGSTATSGINTLVQGSNITFDTTTSGQVSISSTASGGVTTLHDLTDVSITNPITGDIIQYNAGSSKWVAVVPSFALASNISDAKITTPANGQILSYNSTDSKWENTTISVPVDNISGTLYVSKGGTGQTSFTTNGVVVGNGTNALGVTSAPTTSGTSLTWNGTGYEWDDNQGINVQNTATAVGFAKTINFTGAGVTTSYANDVATVAIAAGGSGNGTKTVTFRAVFDNNSAGATGFAKKFDTITDTSIIASVSDITVDNTGTISVVTQLDNTYIYTDTIYTYYIPSNGSWMQSPSMITTLGYYDETTKKLRVDYQQFQSAAAAGAVGVNNPNTICYITLGFSSLGTTVNLDTSIT